MNLQISLGDRAISVVFSMCIARAVSRRVRSRGESCNLHASRVFGIREWESDLRLRVLVTVLCALVPLLAPSSAVGEVQLIAASPPLSPIDAYRGRVIWSELSGGGYQLVEYNAGMTRRLPIAPGPNPYDVDLGPDRRGRVVAVYSRCADLNDDGVPVGCDLYRYDFKRGRETPIRVANTNADERYPAIWKGRLAFVRYLRIQGTLREVRLHRFYWRWLSGRGRDRLLAEYSAWDLSPAAVDLRGKLAAISLSDMIDAGRLDLVRIGGRTRTVGGNTAGVSIGHRFVYWVAVTSNRYTGDSWQFLLRYDFRGRSRRVEVTSLNLTGSYFARDGEVSYYIAGQDPGCAYRPICSPLPPYGVYRATDLPL